MDLLNELNYKTRQLELSIKKLRETGTEYAQAERDYKVTLAQTALKLKSDGMAIGLIDKVIYGVAEVAAKRFKRDVAEAVYKANMESINALKLQMRLLEAQISREWSVEMHE